jgi:replicative DNA helicase
MQDETTSESPQYPVEYQVFALSLRNPGSIEFFDINLPEEIVGLPTNQVGINEFYKALLAYHHATKLDIVSPVTFKSWLESETDVYSGLGGSVGVDTMIDILLNLEVSDHESITQLIKHRANKHKQLTILQELEFILTQKGEKTPKELARIAEITTEIKNLEVELNYNPLDSVATANDISNRAESLLDIPSFLPTQYKSLNRAMGYTDDGGFFRGAVHAIIAPSGKGKSTFAKCLVNNWADTGYKVLYVNFEEAVPHWERVLMTQIIEKNVYAEASTWSEKEKAENLAKFQKKLAEWGNRFMVRHDPDTPYFEDLEKWLRSIMGHSELVPDVIVIDTIQSMFTRSTGKGKPRWGEFEEMMVKLEKLARDMECVLIITAQENANRMKEKREVVQQSDTGGSLSIQQKCAVTIFITEKKLISGDDSEDENIMQLQIPKNRITGSTYVYNSPLVKYVDQYKKYVEYEPITSDSYAQIGNSNDMEELMSSISII